MIICTSSTTLGLRYLLGFKASTMSLVNECKADMADRPTDKHLPIQ